MWVSRSSHNTSCARLCCSLLPSATVPAALVREDLGYHRQCRFGYCADDGVCTAAPAACASDLDCGWAYGYYVVGREAGVQKCEKSYTRQGGIAPPHPCCRRAPNPGALRPCLALRDSCAHIALPTLPQREQRLPVVTRTGYGQIRAPASQRVRQGTARTRSGTVQRRVRPKSPPEGNHTPSSATARTRRGHGAPATGRGQACADRLPRSERSATMSTV